MFSLRKLPCPSQKMALTPPVWFELGRGILLESESKRLKLLLMNEGSDVVAESNAVVWVFNSTGWGRSNGASGTPELTLTRTPKPILLAEVSHHFPAWIFSEIAIVWVVPSPPAIYSRDAASVRPGNCLWKTPDAMPIWTASNVVLSQMISLCNYCWFQYSELLLTSLTDTDVIKSVNCVKGIGFSNTSLTPANFA